MRGFYLGHRAQRLIRLGVVAQVCEYDDSKGTRQLKGELPSKRRAVMR